MFHGSHAGFAVHWKEGGKKHLLRSSEPSEMPADRVYRALMDPGVPQ